jgi:endonuclease/exonuclease/phosphatase family metal-dependent hydrolase
MDEKAEAELKPTVTNTNNDRARRIRVVSYNVHACVGTDRVFAPQRIADVLAMLDADFIALQEVEEREYRGMTVSEYFSDALGLYAAGYTMHKRTDLDYGNLLLSRVRPLRTEAHDLAFLRREPRGAIEADFAIHGYDLRLVGTHFGLSMKERRAQVQTILPFLEDRRPDLTVLCADFNEWLPYSRVHRLLGGALGAAPAVRTFPSRLATLSLDRIYASPLAALVNIEAVLTASTRRASDHLPVVADFDLARLGGTRDS